MDASPAFKEPELLLQCLQQHKAPSTYPRQEEEDEQGGNIIQEQKLPPLGRVLSILLSGKSHGFQISATASDPAYQKDLGNRALAALLYYANVEAEKGSDLNKLLVPLLEHIVNFRDRKNRKQVISILFWLFEDAQCGMHVVDKFVAILQSRHADDRVRLGWCLAVRDLLQQRMQASDSLDGLKDARLIPLVSCIPKLLDLISKSSLKNMPTRLSVVAADCIILVSKYMSDCSNLSLENESEISVPDDGIEQMNADVFNSSSMLGVRVLSEQNSHDTSTSGQAEATAKQELLWEQLDTLLKFIFKLKEWNEESRPLHATGLQQIANYFKQLVDFRDAIVGEARGEKDLSVLRAVMSSYWNRFSVLMLLESSTSHMKFKIMFQGWVEGLQHSLHGGEMEGKDEASPSKARRVEEMQIFFLTCLSLLLGRVSVSEMEDIIQEYGPMLMQALFAQLHSKNANIMHLAIAILRHLLFQSEPAKVGTLKIDTVAPLLMDLLDERDSVSRAVVALVADFFAINPGAPEMERLYSILGSGNVAQRQNALGVLSELLRTLSSSDHDMANAVRQSAAIHLLKCLGDAELVNRIEVSQLFARLDPEFVLPALVQHLYSRDGKVRSAAGASIVSLLKGHKQPCAVLCVLLDCTRNISQRVQLPIHPGHIGVFSKESSLPDVDRVMRLIPCWASEAQGWENIIDVILRKMFSDPSNPVIPRFLSQISCQMLENIDLLFKRVLAFMAIQITPSESHIQTISKEDGQLQDILNSVIFERLSPLLVLKVLPLAAFDGSCEMLYGSNPGSSEASSPGDLCIAQFLVDRACGKYEAHEVRKLAAELLGRCNPGIILPLLKDRLKYALDQQSTLEIKSFLFSLCNMVLLRGKLALDSPSMPCIQTMLFQILLWPCSCIDADTSNMQHGAIDCLAIMIIAELEFLSSNSGSPQEQHPCMRRPSIPKMIEEVKVDKSNEDTEHHQTLTECKESQPNLQESIFSLVIAIVIGQHPHSSFLANHGQVALQATKAKLSASVIMLKNDCIEQTAFRLCMANVLIRATQKLAPKGRHYFLSCVLPSIMNFVQADKGSHVKSACLQLLFSIVHNFKDQIMSYAVDLFHLSLGIMRSKASSEVRLAATRLLASLLTSADAVLNEIAPYLSEALMTLESISRMDSSSELRGFCEKLLDCMTPSDLPKNTF